MLQEVPELSTREVLIIHHTDCGAQAAMRHHDHLVGRMKQLLGDWNIAGWALQVNTCYQHDVVGLLLCVICLLCSDGNMLSIGYQHTSHGMRWTPVH